MTHKSARTKIGFPKLDLNFDPPEFSSAMPDPSIFVPVHYEKNYPYPLLVWLHGDGQNSRQVQSIMPHVSMRNFVAVAPDYSNSPSRQPCDDGLSQAAYADDMEDVINAISLVKEKYNIADDRIFLAGHRSGGTVAFDLAFSNPDLFAGVISIDGALPDTEAPLANLKHSRNLECFLLQGSESTQFDVDQLCEHLKLMHSAGFALTVRQYSCADQLHEAMFRDMNHWMMEIVTGQPSESKSMQPKYSIRSDN